VPEVGPASLYTSLNSDTILCHVFPRTIELKGKPVTVCFWN